MRLFLIGLGPVGRAFLGLLDAGQFPAGLRLVGAADRSGVLIADGGLDPLRTAAHKAGHGALGAGAAQQRARLGADVRFDALDPVRVLDSGFGVDVVVDAASTDVVDPEPAVRRAEAALRAGASVALAGKDALGAAAARWFRDPDLVSRIGVDAALGGAGASLVAAARDLVAVDSVTAVGNASTTRLIQELERGTPLDRAVADARAAGVLEADPELDLGGLDAAVKLAAAVGVTAGVALDPPDVEREDLRGLDVGLLRERARTGATTRLVARWSRADARARAAFEAVPRGTVLAVPPDRVVYRAGSGGGGEIDGERVHVGRGIGPVQTARALWGDVLRLVANARAAGGEGGAS